MARTARRIGTIMSRKSALQLEAGAHAGTARVTPASRTRRPKLDGRLVGDVIAIAFDRCEVPSSGVASCAASPETLCTGCGSARCGDHACARCAAPALAFATAIFDEIVDTRLRFAPPPHRI